ncbi:anti-sigma factor family protein [Paenibacillus sp. NPDC058071]|uniref:anti-sigma factor family protein n=1 Tax=Paenibacillus sp. NPDC058071 TaxID=3346326 RepID=UPI0036D840EC
MNCQEVMELMQRQLDGDLSEQERETLLDHTRQCPDCAAMFERLKRLSAELENLPKVMPSYSLVDAILPQLDQLEPIRMNDAASVETEAVTESRLSRSARKRLPWAKWSGVAAAAVVAGLFIVSYNSGLFQSASKGDAALNSASAPEQSVADSASTADKEPRALSFRSSNEVNVESFKEQRQELVTGKSEKVSDKPPVSEGDQKSIAGGGAVAPANEFGATSNGGEPEKGEADAGSGDSPAPLEASSPDNGYVAKAGAYSVRIYKQGASKAVFETSRKNGQIADLAWSEDSKSLTYAIHLESGGMERYIVDLETLTESKGSPE